MPVVGEIWCVLMPEYGHQKKLYVVWCGPYKVPEVSNKSENGKLEIPPIFDGLPVLNRDSIELYVRREKRLGWKFGILPVKTGHSFQLT